MGRETSVGVVNLCTSLKFVVSRLSALMNAQDQLNSNNCFSVTIEHDTSDADYQKQLLVPQLEQIGRRFLAINVGRPNELLEDVHRLLRKWEFSVISTSNARKGYEYAVTDKPDLIVSDIVALEWSGFQLAGVVQKRLPETTVVLYSSIGQYKKFFKEKADVADGFVDGLIEGQDLFDEMVKAAFRKENQALLNKLTAVNSI